MAVRERLRASSGRRYDRTLLEVTAGNKRLVETWHELVYTADENADRYAIQQRKWREGRGEETEADRRADFLYEAEQRSLERQEDE